MFFFSKTQRVLPDSDQQCQKSKVLYRSLSLHCFFLKQGLPLCLLYFIILPLLESGGSSFIFPLLKIGLSMIFNSMLTNQIFCFYALALDALIVLVWFWISRWLTHSEGVHEDWAGSHIMKSLALETRMTSLWARELCLKGIWSGDEIAWWRFQLSVYHYQIYIFIPFGMLWLVWSTKSYAVVRPLGCHNL